MHKGDCFSVAKGHDILWTHWIYETFLLISHLIGSFTAHNECTWASIFPLKRSRQTVHKLNLWNISVGPHSTNFTASSNVSEYFSTEKVTTNCVQVDFIIHCCCFPMIRLQIAIPVTTQLTRYSTGPNLQYEGIFQTDSNSCDLDLHGAGGRVRHRSAVSG